MVVGLWLGDEPDVVETLAVGLAGCRVALEVVERHAVVGDLAVAIIARDDRDLAGGEAEKTLE